MRRGRKTVAAHIFEDLEDLEDLDGHYLLVYEFAQAAGEVTHHGFFSNLKRVLERDDARRVQKSVIECRSLKAVRAVEALCRHYGARDIDIFEVKGTLDGRKF